MTVAIISFKTSEEAEKAIASSYLNPFKEQEICVEPMSKSYFVQEFEKSVTTKKNPITQRLDVQGDLYGMALKLRSIPMKTSQDEIMKELQKYGDIGYFRLDTKPNKCKSNCLFTYKDPRDMHRLLSIKEIQAFGFKLLVQVVEFEPENVANFVTPPKSLRKNASQKSSIYTGEKY